MIAQAQPSQGERGLRRQSLGQDIVFGRFTFRADVSPHERREPSVCGKPKDRSDEKEYSLLMV